MPEDKNEDSVFEDAAVEEKLPEEEDESPEEEQEEWEPTVSSESPQEKIERKGVKEKADGKIVTVEKWFFTRPRTKSIDGQTISPKETQTSGKPYYPGKLGIRFTENNLVEYYPTMRYFVNDGKISPVAKLNRTGKSAIKKLVDLVVAKIKKPMDEISDKEILDYLVGKKVKIKTEVGDFNGKKWFRNDIIEIL